MANIDLSKLPPALQQAIFEQSKRQGMQPTSGGIPMSQADQQPAPEQQAPQDQPAPSGLQQQPGDKMHPDQAVQLIKQQFSSQLGQNNQGQLISRQPVDFGGLGPLNFLLNAAGLRKNVPVTGADYYSSVKKAGLEGMLPSNLPRKPDGTPYVSEDVFKALDKHNPMGMNALMDKKSALALHIVTPEQADLLFKNDGDTMPLSALRLGVNAAIANTRQGALSLANNKFEAGQIKEVIDSISDAKATNATPMGQQANRLDAIIHGRQILQGSYDPASGEYKVPPAMYKELVMNLARAVSGSGQLSEQTQQELSSPTFYGNIAGAFQKITGQTVTGTTQDILKMYRDQLDRQGAVSMDLFNAHASRELGKGYTLSHTNPAAWASTLQQSFGTHDYRAFVANGPDGDASVLPAPMNLGGRGGQIPPNPNQQPVHSPAPVPTPAPHSSTLAPAAKSVKAPKSLPGLVIH
jgi:hypothetical protein